MKKLITICAVVTMILAVMVPQSKAGNVVDGTVLTSPGGIGTVDVLGSGFGIFQMEFTSLDYITIDFTVENDPIPGFGFINAFSGTVTNSTGFDWIDYHFGIVPLVGGDGLRFETQPPQPGPLAHVSSVFNTLVQPNEDTLDWSGGVVLNGSTVDFSFSVYVPDGIESFQLTQYATVVPEPISSTLFLIGGATLGFRRFRKKFKK